VIFIQEISSLKMGGASQYLKAAEADVSAAFFMDKGFLRGLLSIERLSSLQQMDLYTKRLK